MQAGIGRKNRHHRKSCHALDNRRRHRRANSSSGNDCGEENEMTNPYKKIIKQLEDTQSELAEIENYDEGAYQAIQKAIDYLEYEMPEEEGE